MSPVGIDGAIATTPPHPHPHSPAAPPPPGAAQAVPLALAPADALRQMIAVLENERQALAALDAERLTATTHAKEALCAELAPLGADALDPETRGLAETAQRLNDINRRVRNLLAANVAARIEALSETGASYRPARGPGA